MKNNAILTIISLFLIVILISCNNNTRTIHTDIVQDSVLNKNEVDLSNQEQKALNAFFTSFSEIYLPEFNKDQVDDSLLIQFGVYFNYHNHFAAFKQIKTGSKASISETQVRDTAFWFLGLKIKKHKSFDGIEYKNKNYIIDNASGEAYRFSQVLEMSDLGDSLYSATIEIFVVGSGFTGDINANPESWNSKDNDAGIPESEGKMNATIRKFDEDGNVRYVLLEYLKI